jgi:hypothetical protein
MDTDEDSFTKLITGLKADLRDFIGQVLGAAVGSDIITQDQRDAIMRQHDQEGTGLRLLPIIGCHAVLPSTAMNAPTMTMA